jgi:anti-sigma regulatory factor (Ser/Thr protein kinase)
MSLRQIRVPGRLDQIEILCVAVDDCAREAGFDDRTRYACQLAVGEACENIVKHGYGPMRRGEILLVARASPGEILLELRDSAPPFNPSSLPPDQPWTEDNPPVGGLGLQIMHRVMDEVSYRRRLGQNRLRMCKRLARKSQRA